MSNFNTPYKELYYFEFVESFEGFVSCIWIKVQLYVYELLGIYNYFIY